MKNKKTAFLVSAFFLTGLFPSKGSADSRQALGNARLVNTVFNNPAQAYQGQMLISYWTETGSKAEEVKVFYLPPNKYRFEFLTPDGKVDRIVMSDDSRQEIQLVVNDTVVKSHSLKKLKPIDPKLEQKLLLTNYSVNVKESEKILNRATWAMEISPLVQGKPWQLVRVDRATNVILEIKRYTPNGKTGSVTRFTQFKPVTTIATGYFLPDSDLIETPKDTVESPAEITLILPSTLQGGFSLEGSNQFEVNGKTIQHLRYTDGLLPISVFQTPLPVKNPKQSGTIVEWNRPLHMGVSQAGNIYQWEKDKQYYTLVGDVQPDLLQQIAGPLK